MESLPNEILMNCFQYFDAQELFQIFYMLNHRFQTLLQSFQQLKPTFCLKKNNKHLVVNTNMFLSSVYSLQVHPTVDVNFSLFPNVRCLKIDWPMSEEMQQLCANALPYLQQLTITHLGMFFSIKKNSLCAVYFPCLESFPTNDGSTCLSSLRIVKVQFINLKIYQSILSSCPNLCSFQFSMFTSEESSLVIDSHPNLRRLTINVGDVIWPWNDRIFDKYFICTLYLERLSVRRLFYISRAIESFHDYDWLATVVSKHLKQLRLFNFHL